jgi:hypothetical protein
VFDALDQFASGKFTAEARRAPSREQVSSRADFLGAAKGRAPGGAVAGARHRDEVAKAVTPLHGRILEKLGVSRVIFPEREMAIRIAHSLVMPTVIDYIELSRDFSIVAVPAPEADGRDADRRFANRFTPQAARAADNVGCEPRKSIASDHPRDRARDH